MSRAHRPRPIACVPTGFRPVRWTLAVLVAAGAFLGCDGPEAQGPAPSLTRDEFIDLVVAVRRAEIAVEDADSPAVRFQARRDSILAAHGATEEELYEFLERHTDLDFIDEVWDTITQRLKRPLREPGDTPMRPPERPPVKQDDDGRGARLRPGG